MSSARDFLLDAYKRWTVGASSVERLLSAEGNALTAIAIFCRSMQCLKQTYRSLLPLFCFLAVCVLCVVFMGHFALGVAHWGETTQHTWAVSLLSFIVLNIIYYLLFSFSAVWFLELIVNPAEALQRTIACIRESLLPLIITAFLIAVVLIITSLLVIPGIYLSIVCLYTIPYLIYEAGISPYQSIKSAYYFIKGHWWLTFVSLMLPNVFMLIMMTIFIKLTNIFPYIILLKYLLYPTVFLWMIAVFWTVYSALYDKAQVSGSNLTTAQ